MEIKKRMLVFPKEIQEKCDKYLSRKDLEITYYNGYMIEFPKTNFSTISPHKILLKSEERKVIILYYGEYLYDEDLYFINDTNNACTFPRLRELVTNYF